MLLNATEKPSADPTSLPPYLLDLVVKARSAVDLDPGLTRRCLEEISVALTEIVCPTDRASPGGALVPVKGGLAAWQLQRVRTFVDRQLNTNILIGDLATVAKLSNGHFCRAFKASTGETPHGYVVGQRIRRAQRLMLDTEDSLSQIACACGLTDQAHLTRLFRRIVKNTPLAWRRSMRAA